LGRIFWWSIWEKKVNELPFWLPMQLAIHSILPSSQRISLLLPSKAKSMHFILWGVCWDTTPGPQVSNSLSF
jgi:hypothetical protein